jgi:hypothetical protein
MSINEKVKNAVCFIGVRREDGKFSPAGTAFFVMRKIDGERGFAYCVTAKHVIDDVKRANRPMVARINQCGGRDAVLADFSIDNWYTHPTIDGLDVTLSSVSVSADTFDVAQVDCGNGVVTQKYIEENDIGCGDEVTTVGLLTRHFGRSRNIPIVRTGNIAAMPGEPVDLGEYGLHTVYLVESRSIGGLSGSPVFLRTPTHRIVRNNIIGTVGHNTEYLLGINIGLFETWAHADRVKTERLSVREDFLETMNAGIAVVIPADRITDILQRDDVMDYEMKHLEKHNTSSGFRPSSALGRRHKEGGRVEPANANPAHKEDFTSLLGEAAQDQTQGG